METPYEKQANEEAVIREQLSHIHCPHCQSQKNLDIADYNTLKVPCDNTFRVYWFCEDCFQYFTTDHDLDDEGNIKPIKGE